MKRRAKFAASGLGVLASVLSASLAGITDAKSQDLPTINSGTLMIGSDQVYPPYDYLENGVTKGFDAEVMDALAPKLGVETQFVDTRFANLIPGLQANRYDVIASALYVTAARAKVVDYIPYAKTGGSLMVLADSDFAPQRPEELCGKRVANLKGAAWVPELQKTSQASCGSSPIDVKEYATSAEAAQALLSRGADVVFDDAGVSKAAVLASGGRLKITSSEILFPVVMGIAVKKGNDALFQRLKDEFEAFKGSKEYKAILAKYNLATPSDAEVAQSLAETN
ncbi:MULTISPECIES: transporter substrate-binding domain-containing protein [Aureimonas]|uniref:transporter substrate-binding domain-containing protein n=1 Tax=Aureimonas TaxID=414371 RepID=UPI001FED8951|nr:MULTISPECIES: transporter substrate-binding domain-containing protein [Aureimonas]